MKKQAILMQCHNKPEQINKLISVLPDDKFDFYIHVDKKSDIIDKIEQIPMSFSAIGLMYAGDVFRKSWQHLSFLKCLTHQNIPMCI